MTLNIKDAQRSNTLPSAEYDYAECECCILFVVKLSVIMPSLVMLSVVILNVIMLSVVMPSVVEPLAWLTFTALHPYLGSYEIYVCTMSGIWNVTVSFYE